MLRVTKCALEARWRKLISDEHPALAWLADCAAVLLNRCEVGMDSVPRARRPSGASSSSARRCSSGSTPVAANFLGVRSVSAEMIVGKLSTTCLANPDCAAPNRSRAADPIGGVPWKIVEKVELGVRLPQEEMELVRQAEEAVPMRKVLNTHDYSDSCRGCTSFLGRLRQTAPRCRKRLEGSAKIAEAERK